MTVAVDEILSEVLRLLAEQAGMAPESFGSSGIAHAVRKRISASSAASPQEYLRRLFVDTAEFQVLLEDLVVPETWFFRDALAFRCLARRLGATRSLNQGMVRILSVGCSTGEEVYSLAITLREAGFEPTQFLILGTDVSRRWLDLAQKGTFTSRSFREGDETIGALRDRWCERVGESWQVRDELREGVEFRWGNLAQGEFLAGVPPFEVIFCRNVLIYFHVEARRAAVCHLQRLLSPDGLMCSAPAEARIFSAAEFRSLGSECPFAFRRQDELASAPGAAAHYLRGVVRQAQGVLGEAQRSLGKALYLDPKHYQALVHMMLLAEQSGDQLAAANYRRRAQQAAPPEAQ
jgi:chemotaxis protein methyltransferase WspC